MLNHTFKLLLLITLAFVSQSMNAQTSSPIPISEARTIPLGETVTVSGWVTVANEFGGPSYIQDNTGGIAVFSSAFSTAISRGDSVVVSGPLAEFGNTPFTTGTGLRQISGSGVTFNVYSDANRIQIPVEITVGEMNTGTYEGQLVTVKGTPVLELNSNNRLTGNFRGNVNYTIRSTDATGQLRIDQNTEITDTPAPEDDVNITGVVGRFRGIYQLLPRDLDDIVDNPFVIPGSELSQDQTLDVMTWNIEWFGHPTNGPSDVEQQFQKVKRIIEETRMDIYALQEIANPEMFQRLIDELEDYRGFISSSGLSQRLAYLFRTTSVDSISSGNVATAANWAGGRSPLMFEFDFHAEGETRRVRTVNIHAKAFATEEDYNKRVHDAGFLKQYADARRRTDKVIILGDYNDDVTVATWNNAVSPYQIFIDDPNYNIVTRSLSIAGATSFRDRSMIDHITISDLLFDYHLDGAEMVWDPTPVVNNYLSTTSDHFPVFTRFHFTQDVSVDDYSRETPDRLVLQQNYPNPFNPTTTIRFDLPESDMVYLSVYDILGRKVATLVNGQTFDHGTHSVTFDAGNLTSGMYIYVLQTSNGLKSSRTMMLVK